AWPLAVDLTTPESRPYVGDSLNNTELDLIFGYNGAARLVAGTRWGFGLGRGPRAAGPAGASTVPGGADPAAPPAGGAADGPTPGWIGRRAGMPPGFGAAPPGSLRFASRQLAGEISWLFPLAAMGLLAAAFQARGRWRDPGHVARLFWGLWFVTAGIVFSFAGGMFRPYYVVTMAPPLAALVGAGAVALWVDYGGRPWGGGLLPAALLLTAVWEAYILADYPDWRRMLLPWLAGGSLVAAAGLVAARLTRSEPAAPARWAPAALAIGLVAVLV